MTLTSGANCLRQALNITHGAVSVPLFLVPALQRPSRSFSSSPSCSSKLSRTPVTVPPEVSITVIPPIVSKRRNTLVVQRDVSMSTVEIKGPLGTMAMKIPPYVSINRQKADGPVTLAVEDSTIKEQRAMWGTVRAYVKNHIVGVSEGHTAILRLVGVGYRASIESTAVTKIPEFEGQQFVNLKVGYSHPIELPIPKGVKASTPQPTRILLEGVEREVVMQFAAIIRKWRVPEPYKGKGIFVNDETIKLKAKKIK